MHKTLSTAALGLTLAFGAFGTANAGSFKKFESSISSIPSGAIAIDVVLSEDMTHRANNLPKKLSDRGSTRGLNNGFSGMGFYGERDLERLQTRLADRMSKRLNKAGIATSDAAPVTMRLTIVEAKPSRPTFEQLGRQPGLSYKSIGLGGATLEGELFNSSGQSLGTVSYAWYESDISDAQYSGTWTDANRAIDRFAKHTVKSLKR